MQQCGPDFSIHKTLIFSPEAHSTKHMETNGNTWKQGRTWKTTAKPWKKQQPE
jgi:hypothetical protein